MTNQELVYIQQAHENAHLAGDGPFTAKCHQWLESYSGTQRALLTHSCTAALELAALLLDISQGDEIIMPSYTFVSTANAFVLRGGVPVFVDIRPDTLNLDESLLEAAITSKTKAIVPVHYAGVSCEMDTILKIAQTHGLAVIEDAAQGVMASYKGKALGSIGDLGAYSFHETKNVISGEGGALMVNHLEMIDRAEIIREKGTDRSRFYRGHVDKYSWQEVGSSFLPSELIAAFLWAQFNRAEEITSQRLKLWQRYHDALENLENQGLIRRPVIPPECSHNAHMYYVLLAQKSDREHVLSQLAEHGINAVFHYVPLHDSVAGKRYGRTSGTLKYTDKLSSRLIRLPLWVGLTTKQQEHVIKTLEKVL